MNRRAMLASAVAAALGVLLLWSYKVRFENETRGGNMVAIAVALTDVPLGTPLQVGMLGAKPIPSAYVDTRQVRWEDRERITGVRVTGSVRAGETLMWSDLATASDERRDLSSLVRPGMRGVTIQANVQSSFGGLLRPGDRVDVLLSYSGSAPTAGAGGGSVTIPLLQNVLVLAAGQNLGSSTGTRGSSSSGMVINNVTLSATVEQAQLLTFAGGHGSLTLTLRHPDDIITLDALPDTTSADILEVERRRVVQGSRPTPASNNRVPVRIQ